MKPIKVEHIEQLYWVMEDFFQFWKNDNWPLGIKKRIVVYENWVIDFNYPYEEIVIQIHKVLSDLKFPVELEKIYWEYINS